MLLVFGLAATTASAQVLTPGATIQGTSTNGTPASGATGPLGQIRSGLFGQFSSGDNWLALGESPFGVGGVLPYGLRLQKSSQFGLFNQVTNTGTGAEDLIVGWGENASSQLRMRFISNQFTNTFTDVLKLQGGSLAPSAEITATALSGGETPLRIGVTDAPGSFLTVGNATAVDGQFAPSITASRTNDVRESLFITGSIDPGNDVVDQFGIGRPIVSVQGLLSNGGQVGFRPLFAVKNLSTSVFEVLPNGAVNAAGTVTSNTFLVSSDQRFKEDIKPIENSLDLIRKMRGTTYNFKKSTEFAERNFPQQRQYGFIAQEMEKVLPEAVAKQRDGYYAVNYSEVIPVLVEAMKQLDTKQTETTQLQQQVTELKAQLAELRVLVEKSTGKVSGGKAAASLDLSQVKLEQNAPNPFSGVTRIEYSLPDGATDAVLTVSDMQGRTMKTISGLPSGGRQVVELQAGTLPVGTYIYTLSVAGKEVTSKRMVLTR
ncbi:tail fiber domain-containing protein [Hymenobacter sp.]|uniref:tail fiber domain-containing protein n=1 Tax=Hymenobacter sp. TaxID=1898978 RepID=UPI002ED90A4D